MIPDANLALRTTGYSPLRIRRWTILLGLGGAALVLWKGGPAAAASFSVGALASYFNLQLLHALVGTLGSDPLPGSRRVIWMFVFRYSALGLLGYATVKVFGVNPALFCVGLLVATLALLTDSLVELIYARA
jgi:hypothetical protein